MPFLSKYGVARHIYIPMVKRGVVDHAVSADWTPAAGDVKISKDGGAAANVTNLPVAIAMGNSTIWDFSLTATEMQAAQVAVTIADSATKAVEDSAFIIETHGNASGQFQVDLSDSVRAGLTALPNSAAGGNGGLPTGDANAAVKVQAGTGTGQLDFTSGVIKANLAQILGTALTETAGQIAAAFKKFFNIATPASTMDALTLVATATNLTNAPTNGDLTATMKASVTTAATAATPTAAAVTGNVGGNVVGSVGSVVARVTANTDQWAGGTIPAPAVTGVPKTDLTYILGTLLTETAGQIAAGFKKVFNVAAPVFTAASVNQTGDNFARLGAPAGASVSADIAAVKSDTGTTLTDAVAIKAKTDNLPASPAATGDAMALTSAERNSTADALLDRSAGVETGLTPRQWFRLAAAALFGKADGLAGTTVHYRDTADSKNRITATVDPDGDRSSVTLDAS